jgi:hypothetical protein
MLLIAVQIAYCQASLISGFSSLHSHVEHFSARYTGLEAMKHVMYDAAVEKRSSTLKVHTVSFALIHNILVMH